MAAWGEATSLYDHDTEMFLRWADIDPRPVIASLARCVFGSPFRHTASTSFRVWDDARGVAEAAYSERSLPSNQLDAARLAILADALEEAGCLDAELLAHLRSPGAHVRGCWALDLVLGRG